MPGTSPLGLYAQLSSINESMCGLLYLPLILTNFTALHETRVRHCIDNTQVIDAVNHY